MKKFSCTGLRNETDLPVMFNLPAISLWAASFSICWCIVLTLYEKGTAFQPRE